MFPANARQKKSSLAIGVGLLGFLAVAAVIWASRGPDQAGSGNLPEMAQSAVVFPDGTSLYVQRYEVTVAEWNTCHHAGACTLLLRAPGNRTESEMPATGLSYLDTLEYVAWINAQTGQNFRLPTLHEWEFMAAEVMPEEPDPIFTDPNLTWASTYQLEPQTARTLRPQGSFDTTSEGIVDLNGSVWEWTQDCYTSGGETPYSADRCPAFYVGGEHVAAIPFPVRNPARGGCAVGAPPAHLGMRLVTMREN